MNPDDDPVEFLVITGMSGAGRRTAAHTLEDHSWFVVDNLPPSMMPQLLALARERQFTKVAVVMDVRTRSAFAEIPGAFAALGKAGVVPKILFLEASDEVIVRRQESVRRPLPLQGTDRLLDAIQRERKLLADLRARADIVIDTTHINVHQLSARVDTLIAHANSSLQVTVMSFGFKNGVPIDADLVLDVRFLPNPHWVPELRPQTGLSNAVSAYVLSQEATTQYLDAVELMITTMTPGYIREGKQHATVAIGCTGGKHRSTAISEELARRLRQRGLAVSVLHRDLGLE
ncbi:MAG: RNase adapter RapZ [Propionibacteriaceae bacterium]|nr:RNase adapter RapZ [Propionibacteriaceae bacterium]